MVNLSRALIILFFIPLVFFGWWASGAQATNPPQVVINEIAWMGGEESFADEWIELYNNTGKAINLEGWILKAVDGTPEISLEGTILTKSFYLLERTNNEAVPNIKADLIYKGSLNNKGEHLKLINPQGEIVDEIDCSSEWFAGDNKTKQTMERVDSENWQTSQNPGGTPKAKNSPRAKLEERVEVGPLEEEFAKTEAKKELAAVGEQLPESSNSLYVLLIAFPVAIFSGIIILTLKRKAKTKKSF